MAQEASTGHGGEGVLAAANKIVARATAQPSEALALGILPADIVALQQAILRAQRGGDGRARHLGHGQDHAGRSSAPRPRVWIKAVVTIAGAGTLAFALVPATRALFEALRPKKK